MAGVAAALGRMASDSGLKAAHPMSVVHAANQVAELAMGGHVTWHEADRVFNELHRGWDGNAFSLRSHALICTQVQHMERAMHYFEVFVQLKIVNLSALMANNGSNNGLTVIANNGLYILYE
jgi:tetratricopeptide (TPR) repeat protein